MPRPGVLDRLARRFEPLCSAPGDSEEQRSRKVHFATAMTLIMPAGLLWGAVYAALGAWSGALMPWAYVVLSGLNLLVLARTGRFVVFQRAQVLLIVVLPFVMQLALGGFVGGSAVVMWALLGPLFAVLFLSRRQALLWFGAFAALVALAGALEPALMAAAVLPGWAIVGFFVLNVTVVSAIAFLILQSFVRARERLRELEVAYLDQTVMLRQREKLATLGTLAAGVAHELNNPAAAVGRAADQLPAEVDTLYDEVLALAAMGLNAEQAKRLASLLAAPAGRGGALPPLEQSRREDDLEAWLEARDVPEPWVNAPLLVAAGHTQESLARDLDVFDAARLPQVCAALAHAAAVRGLTGDVAEGSARVSDIVGALRSYSYLDRGTVQLAHVTEGLDSTLVLLRGSLRDMEVVRDYEPDLPQVEVRGSELNQVWTNIVHNAVDATGGRGRLVVRARRDGDGVAIEITDDGPGIPADALGRVFDPFFTTKPPGQGTGLGLNISHNIVVRQHGGSMGVTSEPGRTTFLVELPPRAPPPTTVDPL